MGKRFFRCVALRNSIDVDGSSPTVDVIASNASGVRTWYDKVGVFGNLEDYR